MECRRFRSVVSKMDPLSAGRSHPLSSTALVPVFVKSLSFSISAILGLEDDIKHQDLPKNGEFLFIVCHSGIAYVIAINLRTFNPKCMPFHA